MQSFICPTCSHKWEVNEDDGLLSERAAFASVGYWANNDTNPQNCPECEHRTSYNLPVWLWVNTVEE